MKKQNLAFNVNLSVFYNLSFWNLLFTPFSFLINKVSSGSFLNLFCASSYGSLPKKDRLGLLAQPRGGEGSEGPWSAQPP